ncbi:MAG: peptide deformylase [Gammaproteobacteria bacterium]|nr:peptide deformylase [Gammaproteobacteria bacterium]
MGTELKYVDEYQYLKPMPDRPRMRPCFDKRLRFSQEIHCPGCDYDCPSKISIKPIITDEMKLMKISTPIDVEIEWEEAFGLMMDLLENANYQARKRGCAGLAANQIGHLRRIVVVYYGGLFKPFINPVIIESFGGKDRQKEGCLSRPGRRPAVSRSKKIRVSFYDEAQIYHENVLFTGHTARVLQHEIAHLDGKYI